MASGQLRNASTTSGFVQESLRAAGTRPLVLTIKFFGEVQGPKCHQTCHPNWNALILARGGLSLGSNLYADAAYDSLTLNNMTLPSLTRSTATGATGAAKALQACRIVNPFRSSRVPVNVALGLIRPPARVSVKRCAFAGEASLCRTDATSDDRPSVGTQSTVPSQIPRFGS